MHNALPWYMPRIPATPHARPATPRETSKTWKPPGKTFRRRRPLARSVAPRHLAPGEDMAGFDAAQLPTELAAPPAGAEPAPELTLSANLTIAGNSSEVFAVKFSPDERWLAAGCGDGAIRIFHASNGLVAHTLLPGTTAALPVTALCFRPAAEGVRTRNVLLSGSASGALQHWHVTSGKCLSEVCLPDNNSVLAADYEASAERFAVGCKDASVRVYDEATKAEACRLEAAQGFGALGAAGHSNRVFSVRWHPELRDCLLSGGWDNTVQVWDARAGVSVRSIFGPHIAGDALDVAGDAVLTGSYRPDRALQLWDLGSGRLVHDVAWAASGRGCSVYAARFASAPHLFAAGGSNANEAKVFDARRGNTVVGTVSGLERGVFALDFAPDASKVAVAGGDCAIRVLDIVAAGEQGERA